MPRRITLEIDDHYRERPEIPDAFVLQLLRRATGKMAAHDALELLAWAEKQALANGSWELYHNIGEIAVPLRRQGGTGLGETFLGRYVAGALEKKEAPASGSDSTT
jgi:hypothetical protein